MMKEYNSRLTNRGSWGTWWFNLIPLNHSETDKIIFNCRNEDNSELEFQILLDLSERDWLKKMRTVTGDPSNKHRIKVNVRKNIETGKMKICFGRTSDGWYHLNYS